MEYNTNPIFKRTSIRKYKNTPVEPQKIETILKAAMAAPTACNQQGWEFIVVTKQSILKHLSETSIYSKPAQNAPVAIVVAGNFHTMSHIKFFEQDMAAATQNILLEIVNLNLGGVWMGVAPDKQRMDKVSEILKLPDHIKPFCIIALGYPDEKRIQKDRFNPAKIHYDTY